MHYESILISFCSLRVLVSIPILFSSSLLLCNSSDVEDRVWIQTVPSCAHMNSICKQGMHTYSTCVPLLCVQAGIGRQLEFLDISGNPHVEISELSQATLRELRYGELWMRYCFLIPIRSAV